MRLAKFIVLYVWWHYTLAYKNLFGIWTNYFWFVFNFFSIQLLLKSLFAPWKRMGEDYKKGFDFGSFFSTLIINTFMRLVGALVRLITILVGIISLMFVVIFGFVAFSIWTAMPVLIILIFVGALINIVPHL